MGCDIHMMMVVYSTKDDSYSPVTTTAFVDGQHYQLEMPSYFRNYEIFGLLCDGVRGGGYEGVNLQPRGRFPLNKLSPWAQGVYDRRAEILKPDEEKEHDGFVDFYSPNPEIQVALFLRDYYDEESWMHSHTYLSADDFEKLILRIEKQIAEEKKNIKKAKSMTAKSVNKETIEEFVEEVNARNETIDSLKLARRFIKNLYRIYDEMFESLQMTSRSVDDWKVLVCFDN